MGVSFLWRDNIYYHHPPGERLLRVRNVESTVCCSRECTKDTSSRGGGLVSYIEESMGEVLVLIDLIYN
eukprot:13785275-Ditylum_brightwellii.AAC.1